MTDIRQRGQAIVELVLITTVMFFLLVGALDLGRVFYAQIAVTDAAKEGALVASQGGTTTEIKTAAVTEAKGGSVSVVAAKVTVTTCPATPDASTPPVTVSVAAPFKAITPFVAALLPSDGAGGSELSASAIAQCRYVPDIALVAAPTPTPVPTPTPTPAPTPVPCIVVPDLVHVPGGGTETVAQARTEWTDAGFIGAFTPGSGVPNKIVLTQAPPAGGACVPATTPMTVTHT